MGNKCETQISDNLYFLLKTYLIRMTDLYGLLLLLNVSEQYNIFNGLGANAVFDTALIIKMA